MRVCRGGAQHRLRGGGHAHEAAVFGHQHVAVAQHAAARQEQGHLGAVIQGRCQTAAAALLEGEGQRGGAAQQRLGNGLPWPDDFLDAFHEIKECDQKRK